jgi:hypothetical protein
MDPDVDPIIPSRSPTKWISLPVKVDPGFTGGSRMCTFYIGVSGFTHFFRTA